MVFALLEGRLLERMILHPHGIHEPESMLDRGSLAGGVHALEHEQQAALATRLPLGVELLLHFRQARRKVTYRRCRVSFARTCETRCRPRVYRLEVYRAGGQSGH